MILSLFGKSSSSIIRKDYSRSPWPAGYSKFLLGFRIITSMYEMPFSKLVAAWMSLAIIVQDNWQGSGNNQEEMWWKNRTYNGLTFSRQTPVSTKYIRCWKTSMFLREHVFWSAFNTYPIRQLHLYELPLLIQMCWQLCPWAHGSKPGKGRIKVSIKLLLHGSWEL